MSASVAKQRRTGPPGPGPLSYTQIYIKQSHQQQHWNGKKNFTRVSGQRAIPGSEFNLLMTVLIVQLSYIFKKLLLR